MRYVFVLLLLLFSGTAQAQDTKTQEINQAIDAAERLCLVGDRFRFRIDAAGNLNILKLRPGASGNLLVDRERAKGSQFFDNEDVRRLVDQDIRQCMQQQWPSVLRAIQAAMPRPFKKVVCHGEHESNCAGAHDLFFTCGYAPSPEVLARQVCGDRNARTIRIHTKGGNRCGYGLDEITCG